MSDKRTLYTTLLDKQHLRQTCHRLAGQISGDRLGIGTLRHLHTERDLDALVALVEAHGLHLAAPYGVVAHTADLLNRLAEISAIGC